MTHSSFNNRLFHSNASALIRKIPVWKWTCITTWRNKRPLLILLLAQPNAPNTRLASADILRWASHSGLVVLSKEHFISAWPYIAGFAHQSATSLASHRPCCLHAFALRSMSAAWGDSWVGAKELLKSESLTLYTKHQTHLLAPGVFVTLQPNVKCFFPLLATEPLDLSCRFVWVSNSPNQFGNQTVRAIGAEGILTWVQSRDGGSIAERKEKREYERWSIGPIMTGKGNRRMYGLRNNGKYRNYSRLRWALNTPQSLKTLVRLTKL